MPQLDLYRAKRDFSKTREPKGRASGKAASAGGAFVIHKHAARRLHYDLRLEHDGVLWSWAVTRGPSLDPGDKRLAVHVEDHPLEYGGFEGVIPKGQYGGGSVIIWDEGRWTPEDNPAKGMAKGHLKFSLEGHKLHGAWNLVRLKQRRGEKRDNWLLIKSKDEAVDPDVDILETEPRSVVSGLTVDEVGAGEKPSARRLSEKARRPSSRKKPRVATLPDFVAPSLATLQSAPPSGEAWLHEVKFDGYRVQARIDDGEVRLLTRSGLDWTKKFGHPLLDALKALPCDGALIDGEIVSLTDAGVSSFACLQAALSEQKTSNLVYFAFDLLFLDGEDIRGEPLLARKERLEHLLGNETGAALRYSEHFLEAGETMLRHACRNGLEGVVSKRADAFYRSGRTGDWIKSKCTQRQEFVIAGYAPSQASGRGLGSLVLGVYKNGQLTPAGRVGTGFTVKSAAGLKKTLDRIRTKASPFSVKAPREKGVVWVEPSLVAEVEFRSWTADNIIRHASFVALRADKKPEEAVIEKPADNAPANIDRKSGAERAVPVKLSNPDKLLWPEAGVSKRALLDYYEIVWPRMEPFVVDRPLSLLRAPDGVGKQNFFQKHASAGMPGAIGAMKDPSDGEELLFIRDFAGLAGLVQLGVVEIHIWGATIDAIETPDQIVFDLDPGEGVAVRRVRDASLEIKDRLKELGFESFVKTSGGKGYHVCLPLKPKANWNTVRTFARDFAQAMAQTQPKLYTATLSKKARTGRIFIDYLRNGRGATAVAPYSARARPKATISNPITWSDLEGGAAPDHFWINAKRLSDAAGGAASHPWRDFRVRAKPLVLKDF